MVTIARKHLRPCFRLPPGGSFCLLPPLTVDPNGSRALFLSRRLIAGGLHKLFELPVRHFVGIQGERTERYLKTRLRREDPAFAGRGLFLEFCLAILDGSIPLVVADSHPECPARYQHHGGLALAHASLMARWRLVGWSPRLLITARGLPEPWPLHRARWDLSPPSQQPAPPPPQLGSGSLNP
jgi:hypothetical protein